MRLTPKFGPERPYSQGPSGPTVTRTELRIAVETRVASSRWEDSAALASGIALALDFDPAWQADGIDDLNVPTPATTPDSNGVARGEIVIITYVAR